MVNTKRSLDDSITAGGGVDFATDAIDITFPADEGALLVYNLMLMFL